MEKFDYTRLMKGFCHECVCFSPFHTRIALRHESCYTQMIRAIIVIIIFVGFRYQIIDKAESHE
jgi:hypothetical protein